MEVEIEQTTTGPLFFWKPTPKNGPNACLSNWFLCSFEDTDGQKFSNAEQYMMYHKAIVFNDTQKQAEILACSDPRQIKALGRHIKNFDSEFWDKISEDIVFQGCIFKFTQNKDLKQFLISTGNRLLVEASPYDNIWGIGLNELDAIDIPIEMWPGKNLLGKCLTRVRSLLLSENI